MNAADDIKSTYDFKGLGELKAQAARDQTDDATVQKTASHVFANDAEIDACHCP